MVMDGMCAHCRERFDTDETAYVVSGGVVYCNEECLAQWYVEHRDSPFMTRSLDEIEDELEWRDPT